MEKRGNKKALSPIIATVLLIAIAMVLAMIIYWWAKSFVGEKIQKFKEPIENSCENIEFSTDIESTSSNKANVFLTNKGNVPIYGIELRKKRSGSIKTVGFVPDGTLPKGSDSEIEVTFDETVDKGDSVIVVPIILGETSSSKQSYICDEEFGKTTEVL